MDGIRDKDEAGREPPPTDGLTQEFRRQQDFVRSMRSYLVDLRRKISQRLATALPPTSAGVLNHSSRLAVLSRLQSTSPAALLLKGLGGCTDAPVATHRHAALFLHYAAARPRDAHNLTAIAASGFFDPVHYRTTYGGAISILGDPLLHYIDRGAEEGLNPSAIFDTRFYLRSYPDVAKSGMNPLLHFVKHGLSEGRLPCALPTPASILQDWTIPSLPAAPSLARAQSRRIAIYTAVVGQYDTLHPPGIRTANADFFVFSDGALAIDGWTGLPINYCHADPVRSARFVKLNPHIYFKDYDYSIWLDANIGLRGDITSFIDVLTDTAFIAAFPHPLRDCVYVEAEQCILRGKDDASTIEHQVDRYKVDGFPRHAGLWETGVLVRRHHDPRCIALMKEWWRELEVGSRRDQLSLPVVAQRLSVDIVPIEDNRDLRTHPLLSFERHRSDPAASKPGAIRSKPLELISTERIPATIGIPVFNSPENVRNCLASVRRAQRTDDDIIIVDDASDSPTAKLIDEFVEANRNVRLIRHESNLGYTRSANDILKAAQGQWVVLLNSDCMLPSRALPKLLACGERYSEIGIIGPLSNAGGWQTVNIETGTSFDQKRTEQIDDICESVWDGGVPFATLVNGFCFGVRKSILETVGYFDEESFPLGYGEEDDFCLRAAAAGYFGAIATNLFVYHTKSASFTASRRKILVKAGAEKLAAKYTTERIRAYVVMMESNPALAQARMRINSRLIGLATPAA